MLLGSPLKGVGLSLEDVEVFVRVGLDEDVDALLLVWVKALGLKDFNHHSRRFLVYIVLDRISVDEVGFFSVSCAALVA